MILFNEMLEISKKLKVETYKMKKGNRQKTLSTGNVLGEYKSIINNYKNKLENIIVEFMLEDVKINVKEELTDILDDGVELINKFQNKVYKDQRVLLKSLKDVFGRFSLITDLSKSFNEDHLSDKNETFMDSILNKLANIDKSHDELFQIHKLISDYSYEGVILSSKETN